MMLLSSSKYSTARLGLSEPGTPGPPPAPPSMESERKRGARALCAAPGARRLRLPIAAKGTNPRQLQTRPTARRGLQGYGHHPCGPRESESESTSTTTRRRSRCLPPLPAPGRRRRRLPQPRASRLPAPPAAAAVAAEALRTASAPLGNPRASLSPAGGGRTQRQGGRAGGRARCERRLRPGRFTPRRSPGPSLGRTRIGGFRGVAPQGGKWCPRRGGGGRQGETETGQSPPASRAAHFCDFDRIRPCGSTRYVTANPSWPPRPYATESCRQAQPPSVALLFANAASAIIACITRCTLTSAYMVYLSPWTPRVRHAKSHWKEQNKLFVV